MLNHIIAVDESWAYVYKLELKQQSSEWHHPGSLWKQKVRQNSSPTKVMDILTYDCQGVLVCHPVREGHTVNAAYYSSFLVSQLRRAVWTKHPELLDTPISYITQQLTQQTLLSVTYSGGNGRFLHTHLILLILSPCDYVLIPKVKMP